MSRPMVTNREARWFVFWFLIAVILSWAVVIFAVCAYLQFLYFMGSVLVPVPVF